MPTSKAYYTAHVAENVTHGNRAKVHDVGHRQAGGVTELEYPKRQQEDGAHGKLDGTDAPREDNRVEGPLVK